MVGNDVNLKISRTNTHGARAKLISNTDKTANKPFIARSLQYLGVTVFSTTRRRRGSRINTDRFPKQAPKAEASRGVRSKFMFGIKEFNSRNN